MGWAFDPSGTPIDQGRSLVAFRQHHVVVAVRTALNRRHLTAARLADRMGVEPANLRRKMTGDYPALPEELVAWGLALADDDVLAAVPVSAPDWPPAPTN